MGVRRARSLLRCGAGRVASVAVGALILACSGVGRPDDAGVCTALVPRGPTKPRSIVYVLADTLRRDRLGAYGGPAATPAFDRFAASGMLLTRAATAAPWTKPAVASLFTGLRPARHGVVSHPEIRHEAEGAAPLEVDRLGEGAVTLAELLSGSGYETAAIVSNPWLRRRFGFAQGFATYRDAFASNTTSGGRVTRAALAWLQQRPDPSRPFFLYVHYMDAHGPYPEVPREALEARRAVIEADRRPLTDEARRAIADMALDERGRRLVDQGLPANRALLELAYDQGVQGFDEAFGKLMDGIEALPGGRDVAVVVSADHGEALYARGWGGHGYGLFDDETAIPMAARLPGLEAPRRLACPVGLVDVVPTLCAYVGVACPKRLPGRSWLDAPPPTERYVVTEAVIDRPRARALRGSHYKLLYQPDGLPGPDPSPGAGAPWSLYDLQRDPRELHDLLAVPEPGPQALAVVASMRAVLERRVAVADASLRGKATLDPTTRARLEALGYLGDGPKP